LDFLKYVDIIENPTYIFGRRVKVPKATRPLLVKEKKEEKFMRKKKFTEKYSEEITFVLTLSILTAMIASQQ
jgi:membrane protein DedA with SNARE-associated domain